MTIIVILGAADTGRAPLTAAMLGRRMTEARVVSAGVIGHDGDPATTEALAAADQLNLDIFEHRARTLDTQIASAAALLIAMDSGVARVARMSFPEAAARIFTLGDLAGRARDIPDPFKMQIGAWLTYTREIDELLVAALPQIHSHLAPAAPASSAPPDTRAAQLAALHAQCDAIDWDVAAAAITSGLDALATVPNAPGDLSTAYIGLLRAALALTPTTPGAAQRATLQQGIARLSGPVVPADLAAFSAQLATWGAA